ncbi:tyrosine-protein kinase STYK1 [Platysternon megacephalum]|uniref:Tyrosine-protein kinase STYK1 n=1 Tax=Platysternon megacephalum TaxID=55544 RepID=A0A4D9DWH4_9SAUR|nr:tyrosine-protein kinase STYK1 [Platysternon megacephalum]
MVITIPSPPLCPLLLLPPTAAATRPSPRPAEPFQRRPGCAARCGSGEALAGRADLTSWPGPGAGWQRPAAEGSALPAPLLPAHPPRRPGGEQAGSGARWERRLERALRCPVPVAEEGLRERAADTPPGRGA